MLRPPACTRVDGEGVSVSFTEGGLAVPGGSRANELCPAESGEERAGEGAAGGRAAAAAGRDGEGTEPTAVLGEGGAPWCPPQTCWGADPTGDVSWAWTCRVESFPSQPGFTQKPLTKRLWTDKFDRSCFRLAVPRSRRSGWSVQSLSSGYPRDERAV